MAIKLTSKENTEGVSTAYPFGNIKDDSGAGDGTPVDKAVYADFHQFFEKLMNAAGITHNNLPDNQTDGFQLFDALMKVFQPDDWDNDTLYDNISNRVRFRKDKFGWVHMVGIISQGSTTLTLPVGYRPTVQQVYINPYRTQGGNVGLEGLVVVETSGLITCPNFGIGAGNVSRILVGYFTFKAA